MTAQLTTSVPSLMEIAADSWSQWKRSRNNVTKRYVKSATCTVRRLPVHSEQTAGCFTAQWLASGVRVEKEKNNSTAHSACSLHGPALVCRRRAQDPAAAASRNRSFIAFFSGKRSRVFVLGLGTGFVAEGADVDGRCSCDSGCQIFGRLMPGWFKAGEAQRLLSRKMGKRCERTLGFLEDSW